MPCSAPASGAKLIFTPFRGATHSVIVAKNGSYSVSLPAGSYAVTILPAQVTRSYGTGSVDVVAGTSRKRDFQIDTGIR